MMYIRLLYHLQTVAFFKTATMAEEMAIQTEELQSANHEKKKTTGAARDDIVEFRELSKLCEPVIRMLLEASLKFFLTLVRSVFSVRITATTDWIL